MLDEHILDRLLAVEEQALEAGRRLDRNRQILEARRRVALTAAWLIEARRQPGDYSDRRAFASAGHHLRAALADLDRMRES